MHEINLLKISSETLEDQEKTPAPQKRVQKSIFDYTKNKQNLNEIIARLVAKDGFSIHGITNSSFIRKSLANKGFHLNKNPSHVMNLVHTF